MHFLRPFGLVVGIAACSSEPLAPSGLRVSAESAAVLTAGDSLRVRVTISNDSAEPQRIAGVSCQASAEVYSSSSNVRIAVHPPRFCILPAGTTTVPPYGAVTDLLTFATTRGSGIVNALPTGSYRVRGQMWVVGYGMLRSGYSEVTVSQ